jgi:hypothetical protein
VWGCGGCGGVGGLGCCRVGSLLTFDIPQTALVATLDTYDFIYTTIDTITLSHLGLNVLEADTYKVYNLTQKLLKHNTTITLQQLLLTSILKHHLMEL